MLWTIHCYFASVPRSASPLFILAWYNVIYYVQFDLIIDDLMPYILIQSKVIDILYEIQDGGRRHVGFAVYVNLAIPSCW